MKELNFTGRKTHILLKGEMEEKRIVSSHVVSGLEVSSLDCNDFLELPDTFSQKTIPATKGNIINIIYKRPLTSGNTQAVDTVLSNFYVDDCLKSVHSEEAVSLYHTLRAVCKKGRFRLTKWVSNNRAMLSAIPKEDRATEVKDLDLNPDALPIERALGVHWCIKSGSFRFKIIMLDKAPTMRKILSLVSSVYDPFGILSTVMLSAKGILQHLCRLKIGWDVLIPEELAHEWPAWKTALKQLAKRARVAPLRPMTIPHMELTTANMTACMDHMLRSESPRVCILDRQHNCLKAEKFIQNFSPNSRLARKPRRPWGSNHR